MNFALPTTRVVKPEWLDNLAPDDPRAVRSRRDLVVLNRVMMQAGIMARLLGPLRAVGPGPVRLLELGSGDGRFALAVARRLARKMRGVEVLLLDRQNCISDETISTFSELGWRAERVEADAFEFLRSSPGQFAAITANLFLHHFDPAPLAELIGLVSRRTPFFAACEPRRDSFSLAGSRLVGVLGCNEVTRHDAVASVRAGFSGRELSAFWPSGNGWLIEERRSGLFTHVFAARRIAEVAI